LRFAPKEDPRWHQPIALAWFVACLLHATWGGINSVTFDLHEHSKFDPAWNELFTWFEARRSSPFMKLGVGNVNAFVGATCGEGAVLINLREVSQKVHLDRTLRDMKWRNLLNDGINSGFELEPFQVILGERR
jgi:hypothetical protein